MKYYVSWVQREVFVEKGTMREKEASDIELQDNTYKNELIYMKVPRTKHKPLLTSFFGKKKNQIFWQESNLWANAAEVVLYTITYYLSFWI